MEKEEACLHVCLCVCVCVCDSLERISPAVNCPGFLFGGKLSYGKLPCPMVKCPVHSKLSYTHVITSTIFFSEVGYHLKRG